MNFKISPCNKQEYYLIANLEKSLFDSPFSIKDLENMSLQEAFKIWKIYGDSLIEKGESKSVFSKFSIK